jgi:hypothetical protein
MNIILNQPNTTSTAKVLILEASQDIVTDDPTKPLALTKVITQDKSEHKFWSRDNKPLGSAGDIVEIIVTTGENKVRGNDNEYYSSVTTAPDDFFQS